MGVSKRKLWEFLRKDQRGFRFRRQHPVGPYVMDFYCSDALLCVEVDGEQHEQRQDLDRRRDEYLASLGVLTLRIRSLDLFAEDGTTLDEFLWELDRQLALRSRPCGP